MTDEGLDLDEALPYFEFLDDMDRTLGITCVIQGEADGGDLIAKLWALENGLDCESFPAKWKKYGKRAGYIRNQQMLDEGAPDVVIALPGGAGTKMMTKLARESGVEVICYTPV